MWDLVGNPEDPFSHNEAHMVPILLLGAMFSVSSTYCTEVQNKDRIYLMYCLHIQNNTMISQQGFRPGPT